MQIFVGNELLHLKFYINKYVTLIKIFESFYFAMKVLDSQETKHFIMNRKARAQAPSLER